MTATVQAFIDRTVPLSQIDAHRLVLAIERILRHGFHGFRLDLAAWLRAVFLKSVICFSVGGFVLFFSSLYGCGGQGDVDDDDLSVTVHLISVI